MTEAVTSGEIINVQDAGVVKDMSDEDLYFAYSKLDVTIAGVRSLSHFGASSNNSAEGTISEHIAKIIDLSQTLAAEVLHKVEASSWLPSKCTPDTVDEAKALLKQANKFINVMIGTLSGLSDEVNIVKEIRESGVSIIECVVNKIQSMVEVQVVTDAYCEHALVLLGDARYGTIH